MLPVIVGEEEGEEKKNEISLSHVWQSRYRTRANSTGWIYLHLTRIHRRIKVEQSDLKTVSGDYCVHNRKKVNQIKVIWEIYKYFTVGEVEREREKEKGHYDCWRLRFDQGANRSLKVIAEKKVIARTKVILVEKKKLLFQLLLFLLLLSQLLVSYLPLVFDATT